MNDIPGKKSTRYDDDDEKNQYITMNTYTQAHTLIHPGQEYYESIYGFVRQLVLMKCLKLIIIGNFVPYTLKFFNQNTVFNLELKINCPHQRVI